MAGVYCVDSIGLRLTNITAPTLDAASLLLPEGAYTTLRTYERHRLIGLSAHLQRLVDSFALAHQDCPLDLPRIRAALRTILDAEALPAARLRITTPFDSDRVFVCIEPFEAYPPECYTRGVRCVTTRLLREMPRAKLTAFITLSRAAKAEEGREVQELLLVDTEGRILEGLSSNFFAVLNETLCTAGGGVLEGVTRGLVLAEAQGVVPVNLSPVRLADLPDLTEAFITSSSRDVMPVAQIDHVTIGSSCPGPITQQLMERYWASLAQAAEKP